MTVLLITGDKEVHGRWNYALLLSFKMNMWRIGANSNAEIDVYNSSSLVEQETSSGRSLQDLLFAQGM
jgi:hypothetical protein